MISLPWKEKGVLDKSKEEEGKNVTPILWGQLSSYDTMNRAEGATLSTTKNKTQKMKEGSPLKP